MRISDWSSDVCSSDLLESTTPASLGCVLRGDVADPSNYRATRHLDDWLRSVDLPGVAGVDTRRLTRRIRDLGAPHAALCHAPDGRIDVAALQRSVERRVGKECVSTCRSRWSPYH